MPAPDCGTGVLARRWSLEISKGLQAPEDGRPRPSNWPNPSPRPEGLGYWSLTASRSGRRIWSMSLSEQGLVPSSQQPPPSGAGHPGRGDACIPRICLDQGFRLTAWLCIFGALRPPRRELGRSGTRSARRPPLSLRVACFRSSTSRALSSADSAVAPCV